jgi:tetratricopeptide (TPR) repeat protein
MLWSITLCGLLASVATGQPDRNGEAKPRQLYNEGTQKLREGKLREAEAMLQSAVSSQDHKVQPAALYNLGHARFAQGAKELQGGPDGKTTAKEAKEASEFGHDAIRNADSALAGNDLEAIVNAYYRGRGARKEMKAALEAVKRAVESYGTVLHKWQRAAGDFKGADELRSPDPDAQHNAEVVERNIARLVDTQQLMMDGQDSLTKRRQELKEKMGALKKRMPEEMRQQCEKGEEEEDEEDEKKPPKEPQSGQEEPKPKDQEGKLLSPEEAQRLLEMLRLDANRKLPMGMEDTGKMKDRKRRDW